MDILVLHRKDNKAYKTSDEKNPKYLEFQDNLKKKIASQQAKVKHEIFNE